MSRPGIASSISAPLSVLLIGLEACGGGSAARPSDDASIHLDASPPDGTPVADATEADGALTIDAPRCEAPCFAAGMSFLAPSAMAIRNGTLYIADNETVAADDPNRRTGSIYAIDAGGRVTTLATAQLDVRSLAIDAADTLYWSSLGRYAPDRGETVDAAIMKLARGASAPVPVFAPPTSPGGGALNALVDDSAVYFDELAATFSVNRVSTAGGAAQELARDDLQPGHVRVQPVAMAQHGDRLYWIDQLGGVVTVSKTGGDAATLVPGVVSTGGVGVGLGVAIDDQSFYFIRDGSNGADDTLFAVALQGGLPAPVVQQHGLLAPLIRDGGDVYFRIGSDIYRTPVAGGALVKLASEKYSGPFVVDASYVYWASDGTVFRLPK